MHVNEVFFENIYFFNNLKINKIVAEMCIFFKNILPVKKKFVSLQPQNEERVV